ncbi:MAG: BatD family protein [Candidatus Zophobacter franzmannii]|nr:BatD family protein [Candidatus Zophobacter franzmannii]
MKKLILLIGLIGLILVPLFSSDLKVASSVNSDTIGLQDQLNYKVIVSGEDGNKVSTPSLRTVPGFSLLDTRSSTQSSFSWVNGKTTTSFTKTFTYTLSPRKEGDYTIPAVSFDFKGSTYNTKPIQVKVVKGTTNTSKARTRRSRSVFDNFYEEPAKTSSPDGETFLVAKPNKKSVFKGEPIKVDYTLYTTQNVSGLSISDEKDYPGYGKDEIYTARELRMNIKEYNGKNYRGILLKRVKLMPNSTGKVTAPTLELEVTLGQDFGSFWSTGSPRRKLVRNAPININVKELPTAGKPTSFNGAIGKFTLTGEMNKTELKAGDSFQYTIEIKGTGNISQFSAPEFPEIQNMRVMTPEVQNEALDTANAKKIVKYLVIAQEKGNYTLPSIEFSYFNPVLKKYMRPKTKQYNIKVTEGDSRFSNSVGYVQSSVNLEGRDIKYIISATRVPMFKTFFSTLWYWLLVIISISLYPITLYYVREQDKLAGDADLLRQKNASKILKKYLALASDHANKRRPEFYAAAHNGLIQYLTDKLRIPKGLTTEEIMSNMRNKAVEVKLIVELSEFFKICNQARFMPGGFTGTQINNHFSSLKKLVQEISRLKIKH